MHTNSQISKNFKKNSKKHAKKYKNENIHTIISVTVLQKYFLLIRYQGLVNGLYMILILKSETKEVGREVWSGRMENFFFIERRKLHSQPNIYDIIF